jgi:hypothetical protein
LSIGGGGGVATAFGAGRSGPLIPHAATLASIAASSVARTAPRK